MSCYICGCDWKACDHSVAQVNAQQRQDELQEAIDNRLVELGVVEKTHSKIMQSAKLRARRKKRN